MARQRAFEPDDVLDRAMTLFWSRGYAATSTADLMEGMKLSRQSMYNAFGDKRRLYLRSLQRYISLNSASFLEQLHSAATPLDGISRALSWCASKQPSDRPSGCMSVNAACEFGISDEAVSLLLDGHGLFLLQSFKQSIEAAQREGQIAATLDASVAAMFLTSALSGIRVSARSGATPKMLQDIASMAMRSLT
jgi:TetR/AcrR family transcriptional repressor of nem operon